MIVQAGDDGSGHDADGDARAAELLYGVQAIARRSGARLHHAAEIGIQSGERDEDHGAIVVCEFLKHVDVTRDERVLGDNAHGIAAFGEDFEAAAGDLQLALDGLVAIRHAADGEALRLPTGPGEFFTQQVWRIQLHHDLALKIEAGGEAEVFVRRTRVAIDAAMLATAIGIHTGAEADVRAVIIGDDRLGVIDEELRAEQMVVLGIPLLITLQMNVLEAVRRVAGGTAHEPFFGTELGRNRHKKQFRIFICGCNEEMFTKSNLRRWEQWLPSSRPSWILKTEKEKQDGVPARN